MPTWIEILDGNISNIITDVYYKHPAKETQITIFGGNLKTTFHSLRNNNKICLAAGNFSYDILQYEHNPVINEFLNFIYSNFFELRILEPLRVVLNSRPSLIDKIYINTYDITIHSGKFLNKVTDHMPNFCIFEDTYEVKKYAAVSLRS